jgi:hypothetical protein
MIGHRDPFMTVGGYVSTVRTTGPDDVSEVTRVSRLGCDWCYLNVAHTTALCDRNRGDHDDRC